MKYVLDGIIDEVCCDNSAVAKEILNEFRENVCKNAEDRVILVKDKLNRSSNKDWTVNGLFEKWCITSSYYGSKS